MGWEHSAMASVSFSSSTCSSFYGARRISGANSPKSSVLCCCIVRASINGAPDNLEKEPHKYFDQVTILVRSGDGGNGAVLSLPKTPGNREEAKKMRKLGPLRKGQDGTLVLPMGGQGGDVIISADSAADSLLPFHQQKKYFAKRGSNVNALKYVTPKLRDGFAAPTLKLCVPVGTIVKQKIGSRPKVYLADLASPGDKIVVAQGGRGGISLLDEPVSKLPKRINAPLLDNPKDKSLIKGIHGHELVLELTLRVVADVGLVGLPNAGKSSLLAAVSQAKPDIAAYPFTTLMPNLGRIGGDPSLDEDGGFSKGATLADLPGLIKDAHLGKGLGRMFLRHLGRTKVILHVVDASAENPAEDYKVLCEELRLYNPDYLERPHIIVLNKLDLLEDKEQRLKAIRKQVLRPSNSSGKHFRPAVAVVGISALKREGITDLLKEIRSTLRELDEQSPEESGKEFDHELALAKETFKLSQRKA